MSGLPQSGVILYSRDIKKLAKFYIDMFDMQLLRETEDFLSIGGKDLNIVVHVPPIELPPENFNTVKIFLTVESHDEAREKVKKLDGRALDGEWSNPIFKVCNISDPEGNDIQIREFKL